MVHWELQTESGSISCCMLGWSQLLSLHQLPPASTTIAGGRGKPEEILGTENDSVTIGS